MFAHDGERVARAWHLAERRDFHGNAISYVYEAIRPVPRSEINNLEPVPFLTPHKIYYTGFHQDGVTSPGDREVEFVYLDRLLGTGDHMVPAPYFREGWFLGHYYYQPGARRLEKIVTRVDGEVVHEVRTHGSHDSASFRWRLDSVELCAKAEKAELDPDSLDPDFACLPPHTFEWREPMIPTHSVASDGHAAFVPYDATNTRRKKSQGGPCRDNPNRTCVEPNPTIILDANGDGADDFVYQAEDAGRTRLHIAFGGHSARASSGRLQLSPFRGGFVTSISGEFPLEGYKVIDYDLDGLDDIFFVDRDGQVQILRSTGADFESVEGDDLPLFDRAPFEDDTNRWQHVLPLALADMDGDGRTDILACHLDRWAPPQVTFDGHPADSPLNRIGSWHISLRTANGFAPLVDSGITTNCYLERVQHLGLDYGRFSPGMVSGDYDGDGRINLLIVPDIWNRSEFFRMLRWDDEANKLAAIETSLRARIDLEPLYPVDLNGDGLHDLAGLNPRPEHGSAYTDPTRVHHRALATGEPGVFAVHPESPFDERVFGSSDLGLGDRRILRQETDGGGGLQVHSRLTSHGFDFDGDGRGDLLVGAVKATSTLPQEVGWDVWEWPAEKLYSLRSMNGLTATETSLAMSLRGPISTGTGNALTTPRTAVLDGDGDGALDLLSWVDVSTKSAGEPPQPVFHHNVRARPLLLEKVTNGLGAVDKVSYQPTSNPEVYTPSRGCSYPQRCFTGSEYVVHEVHYETATNVPRVVRYHYKDARVDLRGRGWLGFAEVTSIDTSTNSTTRTTYDNQTFDQIRGVYPNVGRVLSQVVYQETDSVAGTPSSLRRRATETTNSYEVVDGTIGGTFRIERVGSNVREYVSQSASSAGIDGYRDGMVVRRRTTTDFVYDSYGNVVSSTESTASTGLVRRLASVIANHDDSWLIGLPLSVIEKTDENGCTTINVDTTFEYEASSPVVVRTVQRPTDTTATVITTLQHDTHGNVIRVSKSDVSAGPSRETLLSYSSDGYFPLTSTNALGHVTRTVASRRTLALLAVVDPNGVETRVDYDGFGRAVKQVVDGQATETTSYEPPQELWGGLRTVRTSEIGRSFAVESDLLGRERHVSSNIDGRRHQLSTDFDERGVQVSQTAPYQVEPIRQSPVLRHWQTVDNLGLIRTSENADGVRQHFAYEASARTRIDAFGNEWHEYFDAHGRLTKTLEPRGGEVTHNYCGGLLVSTKTGTGQTTTIGYDAFGRRTNLSEPNSGSTQYSYTAFDEISEQTDALGRVTRLTYDVLGRRIQREHVDDGRLELFIFDTSPLPLGEPALGLLHKAKVVGGTTDEYDYDEFTRLTTHKRHVDSQTLTTAYERDSLGRLSAMTYPSAPGGNSGPVTPFRVVRVYSSDGDLQLIKSDNGSLLWQAQTTMPFGVSAVRYGNGFSEQRSWSVTGRPRHHSVRSPDSNLVSDKQYRYDSRGMLSQQSHEEVGLLEKFTYDELGRLVDRRQL